MSKTDAYVEHQSADDNDLVNEHLFLVKRIAYHIVARLPAHIEVDDLIQVGLIGLLDAAKNYSPTQGATFQTYANLRIRGSIIDELRRNDWVPRSVQFKARQLTIATQEVENILQRTAKDVEIAEHLGLTIDAYHAMLRETVSCRSTYVDTDTLIASESSDPHENLEDNGFQEDLTKNIDQLPEREKLVMSLYYEEELNLKEIGEVIGVSESRVSQIHSQAIARLRAKLDSWITVLPQKNV